MNEDRISKEQLYAALKKYWGYEHFRPMQLEAMLSVCGGRDTLALMPTGAGKSMLYQVPTLAREDGFCIVVTPLIALMKDQVDKLKRKGIPAVAVHSGLTPHQVDVGLDNCIYGDVRFLYIAPERIGSEIFRTRVPLMKPTLIAVDEAHCISQWGYDFRPAYLKIHTLRTLLPQVPVLALTASATERVADDVMSRLDFKDGVLLRSSFERANLSFSVRKVEDKNQQLMRMINNVAGQGIVYLRTREGVEQVAESLKNEGVAASPYHGGMGAAERAMRQDEWMSGKTRIMVATNAFGMGVDKPDVRFVVHYSVCDSIESYYQEAGRAGRDGGRAYALLLVSPDDKSRARHRFESEFPSLDTIKRCYESIFNYLQIGVGEGKGASLDFDVHDFCRSFKFFTPSALSAISILQQNGYLTFTDEADHPSRIMFCVSRDSLYRIRVERGDLDYILRVLLRMYGGLFTEFRAISEKEIAVVSGYTVQRVRELLKMLWQLRIIRYIPSKRTAMLYLDEPRYDIADLYISPESYKIRKDMAVERYRAMFEYADNDTECRSVQLRRYFGEADPRPCGICDVCIARRKSVPAAELTSRVLEIVRSGGATVKDIVGGMQAEDAAVLHEIAKLVENGKIEVRADGIVGIIR